MPKKIKDRKLNERERALRDYLLNKGDKAHVTELCRNLPQYYTLDERVTSHDPCVVLRNDVLNINKLTDSECFICQDHDYNYWIAKDIDELLDYLGAKYKKAVKSLSEYWTMLRKSSKEHQMSSDDFHTMVERKMFPNGNRS